MNLADALIGSLVFAVASSGSLELTARLGQSLLQQRTDAERMEQIDLAVLAGEQALRRGAALRPIPDAACIDPASLMVTLLETEAPAPLLPGLQRRVVVRGHRMVSLELSGGGPGLNRSRLFTAGAYGLCQPEAEPPLPSPAAERTP